MLIRTIAHYLKSHKRLVVPQLGVFLVKEPGRSVLFSELLKRDDGVLRGLLLAEGLGEVEAAGEIDRFVFEVRHAVQNGREYRMGDFGVLKPGPNGTVAFVFMPSAGRSAAQDESARAPRVDPARLAESVRTAFAEPHVSESPKMNPDPSVRGLRYRKPHKNTDAYTYVDGASRRSSGLMWVMWFALAAILLALGAIGFGIWQEAQQRDPEEGFYGTTIVSTVTEFFGTIFKSGR